MECNEITIRLPVEQLHSRAQSLFSRFEQGGGTHNIDDAIVLDREALELCPPGHSKRSDSLICLGIHLSDRYNQLGAMADLNEAIIFNRGALVLCPPGHLDRPTSLNNLANTLSTRYNRLRGMEDLDEAIALDREALALRPPGHPDRSMSLNNLAIRLSHRYNQSGKMKDLDEAIALDRDALELLPPGDPDRPMSLSNLADDLSTRFIHLGDMEDLDEAIVLDREALVLRPPGHADRSTSLSNLADDLSARYDQLEDIDDINEAIALDREALELCPPGHPRRSHALYCLADRLQTRFMGLSEVEDREELFSLYAELECIPQTMSSSDLDAAKAWAVAAEDFLHPSTLLAYETCLRLLVQHLAALPSLPQHLTVLKDLTSSLAVDAFSACLRNHSPTNAVELLEQGRGVFWSQLTRLRSPLDIVISSGPAGKTLADEFTQLTSHIRDALKSPSADQHDRVCHLNLELKRVVDNIRKLPDLSRFLLPSLFSEIRLAASGGPVIIVNASQYSCDALVVLADRDPVHIPLSITKDRVQDLSLELNALTVRAKRVSVMKDLGVFLRELWDQVVSPVVEFLQTIHPYHSRIWWCPTAEFSLLPLHAAGPYRKDQQNLADLYISSYTPTLTALIRARRHDLSIPETQGKHFVAIGEAKAMGQSELLSVATELTNIGQLVDGLANFTRIEGQASCISRVAEELGKNQWVHFACHGLANRERPFESAFALHDGHFTIQRIIQCELENPQFAYLSACHTTVGDEESPDEVIHLASAMQFVGFRSVIGTMWAVDDAHTNKITSMFYKHMVDETGRLDHTRAAFALHTTMKNLKKIPFDQRVLYIHLGA